MKKKTSAHRSDLILLTKREVQSLLEVAILDLCGTNLACAVAWDLDERGFMSKKEAA